MSPLFRFSPSTLVAVVIASVGLAANESPPAKSADVTVAQLETAILTGDGEFLQQWLTRAGRDTSLWSRLTSALKTVERRGHVPAVTMGRVWMWLATVAADDGRNQAAHSSARQAVQRLREALADAPEAAKVRLELSQAMQMLAVTAPPEQSAERFDRLAEAAEHAVAAAEQFLGEHDENRARQAVRTAERAIARMLETIGEHGDAGQAFDHCIRAIERLARLQPALDKSPSAAERLLQPAVARAVALRDAEALERCLNVVQIVGRSTTPWRPASWYLTIALSQQDDPAYRDRLTRAWLLDFCQHWLLRHTDAAMLDLKYRLLVRRYGEVPTREVYEELKRFWETQRTQWLSSLQALDEDPVLAQWAALRWLAFWADELGLAHDVRKWVAQARNLAIRYPLRRFRQEDLFHLLWRNRQLQPDGTRRRNDPGVELARQRGRLARAPIWLMPNARRVARLALIRDVLRHWLSRTSAAGSSPAYSPRADLARAVSSYAALLDASNCPEPREPNDPCADPNAPDFDPNDCPPVIRNGWSRVVWRRWLCRPAFQAAIDVNHDGRLDLTDLETIQDRLWTELRVFRASIGLERAHRSSRAHPPRTGRASASPIRNVRRTGHGAAPQGP